jgi:hypothetical protein
LSTVTNLILCAGGMGVEAGKPNDDDTVLEQVNPWLVARGFQALKPLHEHFDAYVGTKVLEANVFVAAYNCFPVEEFVEFLKQVPWAEPDLLQCFVQLQDDDKFTDWMRE